MRRRMPLAMLGFAALALSGCYRITVNTGAPVALASATDTTAVTKPWNHSFIDGLVAPAPVKTKETCTNGVATVTTQRSFLNGLVAGITYGLYTPVDIRATCAAGRAQVASAPAAARPAAAATMAAPAPAAAPAAAATPRKATAPARTGTGTGTRRSAGTTTRKP